MRWRPVIPTSDDHVGIEEQREGYVRYRNRDRREWEVHGTCDRRGDCLVGSVLDGEQVRDHYHIAKLCRRMVVDRPDSELDVPVTPEFDECCASDGTLRIVELKPGEKCSGH